MRCFGEFRFSRIRRGREGICARAHINKFRHKQARLWCREQHPALFSSFASEVVPYCERLRTRADALPSSNETLKVVFFIIESSFQI